MNSNNIPIDLDEQLDEMKRYIVFRRKEKVISLLDYAGYFRISRYGKFLLSKSNTLGTKPKHTLLIDVYNFDVELRKLLFEYCKYAEIQLRKYISDIVSLECEDACFYLKEESYTKSASQKNASKRRKNINFFENKFYPNIVSNEEKIRADMNKHPELSEYRRGGIRNTQKLPSWVYFYYIDFGNIALIYKYLRLEYKKKILDVAYPTKRHTKINAEEFVTWLDAIKNLRNTCCHHNILLGKTSSIVTENAIDNMNGLLVKETDLFSRLYALKKILPNEKSGELKMKLIKILKKYKVNYIALDILPTDWEQRFDNICELVSRS